MWATTSIPVVRVVCPSVCPSHWDKQNRLSQILVSKAFAKGVWTCSGEDRKLISRFRNANANKHL